MSRRGFAAGPGTNAFVVGASQGIGRAVACALAAQGASVAAFARRPGPLEDASRAIHSARTRPEARVRARSMDACDPEETRRVLQESCAELGPPDLLVNCAGGAKPDRFESISPLRLEETLRQNVLSAWNPIQALLPELRMRRATIVNTSSVAGLVGVFGYTDYCAAKFALIGFSEALRGELAPHGIRVSVLCPPDTDTPGLAAEEATKPAETRALSRTARLLSAEQVAEALLRGLARGRFLIVPGRSARLVALAARHLPGLTRAVMDREVRRARRGTPGDG